MTIDDLPATIIHGSPEGYDLGCRSKGGCANHNHPTLMTCIAAHRAASADWALGKQPRNQPIPKNARRLRHAPAQEPSAQPTPRTAPTPLSAGAERTIKHGAPYGYSRGCKDPARCPGGPDGTSCTEANRRYYREYYATRRANTDNRPIPHGTLTGYSYGCYDRTTCPGGPDGISCADAARAAEQQRRGRQSQRTA